MFCHVPFTNLHIFESGDVYCCCPDWLPRPLGNLLHTDLEALWRGPVAEDIRSSILDGSFRYCTGCVHLPKIQGPITELPASWAMEKIKQHNVHMLILDYDRTCNLSCPSCRLKIVDRPTNQSSLLHKLLLSSGILQKTDNLLLTGSGDPFASPYYFRLLQDLPLLNPSLQVCLLTNGLLLDEPHWQKLGPTRERVTSITISIDAATPETYRLNRGGSWDRLWRNIDFVRRLRQERPNLGLSWNYVVQANNFRELIPFARLASEYEVDHVNAYFLSNWGTFSSDAYKERAVHLPEHPEHAELRAVLTDPRLASDPHVILPTLPTLPTP